MSPTSGDGRAISRIVVEGFKSIRLADLKLGKLTVLIGANGAGKSNFIEAFEVLGRIADEDLQLEVGLRGGAQALLHSGINSANEISIRIEAESEHEMNAYLVQLVPAANDEMIIGLEQIFFQDKAKYESPWNSIIGRGSRETRLREAAKHSPGSAVARLAERLLRGCRVYHFQDTSRQAPVKGLSLASNNLSLAPDAGNIAAFLMRLQETDAGSYQQILRTIRAVAPFFRDFVLVEEQSGRVRLRWRQVGDDTVFPAEAFSDGTLRFICLATLLLQPNPPALLVLDEPELGLHPFAIKVLAGLLRGASQRSQVFLATQSVTLLDQFTIDEVVVAQRGEEGATELARPTEEELRDWLDEYTLGELWLKNVLGGRPTQPPRVDG